MFLLASIFYLVTGQVKLAMVLVDATVETVLEMLFDLYIFIRYDIYDIYLDINYGCVYETNALHSDHSRGHLAVFFFFFSWLLYRGFVWVSAQQLVRAGDDDKDNAGQETAPATVSSPPAPAKAWPSTSTDSPSSLPIWVPRTFEHFNGTGDSFLPHLQADPKREGATPKSTFLNKDVEAKYGFTQRYDHYKGYYWAYQAPKADKRPSITAMIEAPVEPQPVVKAAKPPPVVPGSAAAHQDVFVSAVAPPPPPPALSMAPTMAPAPKAEALPAGACQPLPPPPPPSFEMVCSVMAAETSGLKNAMTRFFTVVNSSGDLSEVMLALGMGFEETYKALGVHRTQLTLDESRRTGWSGLLEEFYAVVHPNAYWLVTMYKGDMLEFLQAVLTFGRFLGLVLPEIDLSAPPPAPCAPAPPPPTPVDVPTVHQAAAPPPPPSASAASAVSAPAPAPAPPTFSSSSSSSSSGIKPSSSRASAAAARNSRSGVQRRTAGARHQDTPKTSQQLDKQLGKQPAKKVLDFDDLDAWNVMDQEELAGITVESFGWADDNATSKRLWTFTTGKDLVLGGSWVNGFTADFIVNEIDSKAGILKRAAWVLGWQARAPFSWQAESDTAPMLLGEMSAFLYDAGQKADWANARGSLREADDFMDFFRFHWNLLGRQPDLREGLAQQYNEASVLAWLERLREEKKKLNPPKKAET